MKLEGKTALVTGGNSGIGRATALALAELGCRLHLVGRDETKLNETVQAVSERGGTGVAYPVDLSKDEELEGFCKRFIAGVDQLDLLVHSAGMVVLGSVAEQDVATFDAHYRVNLRAPYALTQCLLPLLLTAQGQIVFVNSGAGLNAKGNWSQYAASKHGLRALADSLREEVKGRVKVLSIYPGRTASDMQRKVREMEGEAYEPDVFIQPEDVAEQIVAVLGLPRSAEVTDLTIRPGQ